MRDYQVRASHKLFCGEPARDKQGRLTDGPERDGTAIHIDMGLGKTVIGLTAIVDWRTYGICDKTLVIAPIRVCETVWRQEAHSEWEHTRDLTFSLVRGTEKERAFALARKADVYLINPEGLRWLAKWLRNDWSMFDAMLIDESSMFRDNRSQRFRVLSNYGTRVALKDEQGKALRDEEGGLIMTPPHRFKRSGIMTGTPAPSSYMNLWAPLYLIDHGRRLHSKFNTFQGRFFHKAQQVAEHIHKYELNNEEDEIRPEYVARDGAPERIHELIADITVELNAADYGILPERIEHQHAVELPGNVRVQYDQLERDAIMELEKDVLKAQNGGAKTMMCWQIANGAIYQTDDYGTRTWQQMHEAKLERLVELVDLLDTNVIIVYNFEHDLIRIKERFHNSASVLKGGKTERIVNAWNKGEIPILLLHPKSGGHGLNLQHGGHTIIWFSMTWSLEQYQQTNARLARSGQRHVVGIHHILTTRTTDELMFKNLHEKGDDQTRFRRALRDYQQLRQLGLYSDGGLHEDIF